jgi:CBS-domain-containing membrane protein
MQITDVDLELLRLEEVLRVARERLAGIIRMVPDPAVLKAAEDLCAKAIAALGEYRRKKA